MHGKLLSATRKRVSGKIEKHFFFRIYDASFTSDKMFHGCTVQMRKHLGKLFCGLILSLAIGLLFHKVSKKNLFPFWFT